MAGNAFVIGDGFHAVQVALGGVIGVDEQPSRPAAVCRAGLVIRGRRGLGHVVGHRNHFERRLGKRAEKLRQLGLHRLQIAAIRVEQRIGRSRVQLGIRLQAFAETLQVLEAELLRDGQHLGFVFLHFVQADLVNLVRGQVGGRGLLDQKLVVLLSVGQGVDAGLGASRGNVAHLKKTREAQVGGQILFRDRIQHCGLDALLLGGGNRGGKVFERQGQRRVFGLLIGELLHLVERLFQQVLRRHAPVLHADRHVLSHLRKCRGQRMQPRDPVVVIFHRGETQHGRQPRIVVVDAAHLVHRHLPLLELRAFLVQFEFAHEQILARLLLVGEPGGVDRRQAQQKLLLPRQRVIHRLHGVVAGLVVVALVAEGRGKLGIVLELVLPVLVEEIAEGLAAVFKRDRRRRFDLRRELQLLRAKSGNQSQQRNRCDQGESSDFFQGSRFLLGRNGRCIKFSGAGGARDQGLRDYGTIRLREGARKVGFAVRDL